MSEIESLKAESSQFYGKMIVSKARLERAIEDISRHERVRATPSEDLRFVEGLANLPYGHIKSFYCIPEKNSEICECGREPNAADIVAFAVRRSVHDISIVRDALIGIESIFENAKSGREGSCLSCNRRIVMRGYWTNYYLYA